MTDDFEGFKCVGGFSSPPCLAGEVAPDYFDPLAVDPQQARDVARWRVAERNRLLNERKAMRSQNKQYVAKALTTHLTELLAEQRSTATVKIVSLFWPIKDEPDLRLLMHDLHGQGWQIALPVVVRKAGPLVFREWCPTTRMTRGRWNIPVPSASEPELHPQIVIAPLVGWDAEGYRLGYGGGYFDRTLGATLPKPLSIGVGFSSAHVSTIFPQPHDIPLDAIITEAGREFERE